MAPRLTHGGKNLTLDGNEQVRSSSIIVWYNFNYVDITCAIVRIVLRGVTLMDDTVAGEERHVRHARAAPTDTTATTVVPGPAPIRETDGTEMEHERRTGEAGSVGRLEGVDVETARLTAQVRGMVTANRALHAANDTLTETNTGLRRDTAAAQADTAAAQADTTEAWTTTRRALTRNAALHATNETMETANAALHATNDAMDARAVDLVATVAAVEHTDVELRAQLAAILDDVEEAVLVVDQAGTAVRMNAAYARLVGAAAVLVPDDAWGAPLPPDQTPQARAAHGDTFTLSFSLPTGVPSLTGEDTRRWFVATGQPLQEGGVTHGLIVIRDVTLADRHRSLQDEFLTLAGHELRTPLTSVQAYLDLLAPLLHADGDERACRYATRALHQTRRLVALVRDLTDAARLHDGTLRLALTPLDLVALVTEVVETARAVPPAHPIRLTTDEAPVWVRGDAGRLEQVLFNLLTNAATHAPSVRAIDVCLRRVGSAVALEVRDYGRGIADDQLPHLCARFYQVARADRPAQGGLGLGLFLCQQLIAAHEGRITVVSSEGTGTTVTVWLPLVGNATTARDMPTAPPHATCSLCQP